LNRRPLASPVSYFALSCIQERDPDGAAWAGEIAHAREDPMMITGTVPKRMRWWIEARFGMFIHWRVYSNRGRGERVMYQEHFSNKEYARLAEQSRPSHFNARDGVSMAQDASMRYMGFDNVPSRGVRLFDSQVSGFTAPKMAARREFIAENAEACQSAGMRMGFYDSLEDWRFLGQLPHLPIKADSMYEPMVEQAHAQVHKVCSNYDKVDVLWYDGYFPSHVWRAQELNAMVRRLQPDMSRYVGGSCVWD